MQGKFKKLEEWLLFFMILFIPLNSLPGRYKIPILGKNISVSLLVIMLVVCLIWWYRNKEDFHLPHIKFLGLFCFWTILCTCIGAYNYPFFDSRADAYLATKSAIETIAHVWPGITQSPGAIHLVYTIGDIGGMLKGIFLPLVGMYIVFCGLYGKNAHRGVEWISKAVMTMACIMGIYSAFEIYWIWTNSPFCAKLLSSINVYLFDPALKNGWWPPLLWVGQLRSYTTEPSFFGIMASFMVPFLWYRIFQEKRKIEFLFLIYFVLMIFMTKARTATVVYLGEVFCLLLFSLILRYDHWKKACLVVLLGTIISFGLYIGGSIWVPQHFATKPAVTTAQDKKPSVPAPAPKPADEKKQPVQAESPAPAPAAPTTSKPEKSKTEPVKNEQPSSITAKLSENRVIAQALDYIDENIFSITDKDQRSNTARFGNAAAMVNVGLDHPVFGVGHGFVDRYMITAFPDFAKDNPEVKRWTSDIKTMEFGQAGYPVTNGFAFVLAEFGIPGLLLFCTPIAFLFIQILLNRKKLTGGFDAVCLSVALAGQVGCLFSNWFFYTYPLALCLAYCFVADRCSKDSGDIQNKIK